jgi:hypothetical protein
MVKCGGYHHRFLSPAPSCVLGLSYLLGVLSHEAFSPTSRAEA